MSDTILNILPHQLYVVVMILGVIGWLALIVSPRQPWANLWCAGLVIPLLLCAIYMYSLLTFWFIPTPARLTQFLSLSGVVAMLSSPGLLLVAWINIIAMDLVVGAWMARKATQIGMPYLYLLPCLIVTFVFAGFGFTLFSLVVAVQGRWSQVAAFEAAPPANSAPVAARPSAG